MSRQNIPPLLEQYRENMLDPKNPATVRHNYMMTLQNIRDFCDGSLREYEKKVKK
jgi:hypothetical protein